MTAANAILPMANWVPGERLKNWAGNIEYSTDKVSYPKSIAEVQSKIKSLDKLKTLGTRHCFNRIADDKHHLLSTKNLKKIIKLDADKLTVTVEGGIKYGELAPYLHQKGFALHNLASLPHISVAGSVTTATHGSGMKNGNLSTAVRALELITADGSVVQLSRESDEDKFLAAVVGLGAFGVITKVTLAVQPTFDVQQRVYTGLPMSELKGHFEEIMSGGYSVSLFTDWATEAVNEVWVKSRVEAGKENKLEQEFFGAKAATKNLHPIAELSAENCTEQMGAPGPWFERLPHFKMGFTPSAGKELQSEFFVPRLNAVEAIEAIQKMGKQITPHLLISEIRAIDADEFWMSPCRNQASVAIHFTWKQDWPSVSKLLPKIEKELSHFHVRPHWGKLFTLSPEVLMSRYEKAEQFKKMVTEFDPKGKFRNEFLNKNIFQTA